MKYSVNQHGTSLLETLIAFSLFSFFALQTIAFCLRLHQLTRQSLYDTEKTILIETNHHRQKINNDLAKKSF